MTEWKYGDAGDRYPIKRGEVWTVGRHTVACGDLYDAGLLDELSVGASYGHAEAVYVDPPWNAGNEASFRTKAALTHREGSPASRWIAFCAALVDTLKAACPSGPWFVEGTAVDRHKGGSFDVLESMWQDAGRITLEEWEITYYRTNPCLLAMVGLDQMFGRDLTGLDDEITPHVVIGETDYTTWFDPCCGRGLTALAAHQHGRVFVGVELNPRRAAVTLDRLARAGAGTPRLISGIG